MKVNTTYFIDNPEGYPDAVITTENQHKYVAFYGGIFTLDLNAKGEGLNPFFGGGLVGKNNAELEESIVYEDVSVHLTSVCSIDSLIKVLHDYNPEEFNKAVAKVAQEPQQPVLDMLLLKPENF